jgi:hypothetical protein
MILAAKIALACAGTVVAGTTVLCSEGFLRVNVTQRGSEPHHINVIAPAMLVPIAIRFASHFETRRKIDEAADKLEPWAPTIRAALTELNNLDDMTLVEVSEPGDHVRVEKIGSAIVVDVDDKDTVVHVSAPIRAISSTVQQIADAADSPDSADESDSRSGSNR